MKTIRQRPRNARNQKTADHDARQKRSIRDFDRLLTGGLIIVAATAAALPWYVFLNPEKFGISGAGWEALTNVPRREGDGAVAVIPQTEDDPATPKQPDMLPDFDALTTATIPTDTGGQNNGDGISQPFPGGTRFKLLHVSNGRALIEDKSGMFLVQIGSTLPDESRLISMTNVDGKWQIITSAGEMYTE